MHQVDVDSLPLERLAPLIGPQRAEQVVLRSADARALLDGRTVWNVNTTATGGGVAEMLTALLAYARGVGVDTRWVVIDGDKDFFTLTKRLHNHLHGAAGDGGPLGDAERPIYERVLEANLAPLRDLVRAGDIVLLHDPQTAGLAAPLIESGAHVAWRCHIGRDEPNELSEAAWAFLRPYVEPAHALVFSRREYTPAWVDPERLLVIPPSLDPFSAKNCELDAPQIQAALRHTGIVDFPADHGSLAFTRRDGSPGEVRRHTGLLGAGQPIPGEARVVLQVSRWDHLKDMAGVMRGFVDALPRLPDDVHLVLVGPDVSGVSDDPEGALVLEECQQLWLDQEPGVRARLHLCSLPMDDTDENAHLVNALQRHAEVVVQKSLMEGFGLTVTEPMWKSRPVIASRIGGIQDQIVHRVSGLLLDDPEDLAAFGDALVEVLTDTGLARRLGAAAHERVRDQYLGDRHLIQYVDLFHRMLGDSRPPA